MSAVTYDGLHLAGLLALGAVVCFVWGFVEGRRWPKKSKR